MRGCTLGKAEVVRSIQGVANAYDRVAVHFMQFAIVFYRILVAPDRYYHGICHGVYCQRALLCGNFIVSRLRVFVQRIAFNNVVTAARHRLAAFNRDTRKTVVTHERTLGDFVAAVRQRRAVIRLGGAIRRQFDRHRGDLKSYMAIGFAFFARNPHRLVTLFPCFYPNFLIAYMGCLRVIFCPVLSGKLIPYFQTIFVLAKNVRSDSMRSAIIRSNILLCVKNDIIHLFGIVNRNDVLTISCNGYFLPRLIPDNRIFIAQTWMLVRHIHCVNQPEASFVFRNFRRRSRTIIKIMVNSISRLRKFEVNPQNEETISGDNTRKHVVRVVFIKHVAGILRSLVGFGYGNGRVRGAIITDNALACRLRIRAVRVLIVELDGVLGVGVRRPDGVEDVRAVVVVYLHLRAGSEGGSGAIGGGVPAREGIARLAEAGILFGEQGNGRVIVEVFNLVLACAAIGFIGQGGASGTRAPLGGEGDDVLFISVIALDLVLIAGLIGGRVVRPAEEVLAISSNQLARGHEVSKAVLRVGLAIHRSGYVFLDGIVFNFEGAVLGVVGVEGDIRCDLGFGVEGLAGAILAGTPAAPGIAFANLRHDFRLLFVQRGFNRVALRDVECNR